MLEARLFCEVESCDRSTHSGSRYCSGHAKWFELGKDVDSPLKEKLSLRERVQQLAVDLVTCDSENDVAYERAWDALEHALRKWSGVIRARHAGLMSAKALSAKERKERAQKAAAARWWDRMLTGKHPGKRRAGPPTKGGRRAAQRR